MVFNTDMNAGVRLWARRQIRRGWTSLAPLGLLIAQPSAAWLVATVTCAACLCAGAASGVVARRQRPVAALRVE
jgi:hypothetical protein